MEDATGTDSPPDGFLQALRARSQKARDDVNAAIGKVKARHELELNDPANVIEIGIAEARLKYARQAADELRANGADKLTKVLEVSFKDNTGQRQSRSISIVVTPKTARKVVADAAQALRTAKGEDRHEHELRPYYAARTLSGRTSALIRKAARELAAVADTPDQLAGTMAHWETRINRSIEETYAALAKAQARQSK